MKTRTYETTIPISGYSVVTVSIESEKEPTSYEIYTAACADLSARPTQEQIEAWSTHMSIAHGFVDSAEYTEFEFERVFDEENE